VSPAGSHRNCKISRPLNRDYGIRNPSPSCESGAIETDSSGNSIAATKAAWTANLLAGVEADPQIIGFSWFDNTAVHLVDGISVEDDWQFDSDPLALQAFASGVQSSDFAGGLMPDASS